MKKNVKGDAMCFMQATDENDPGVNERMESFLQPLINCDSVLYGGCSLSQYCQDVK